MPKSVDSPLVLLVQEYGCMACLALAMVPLCGKGFHEECGKRTRAMIRLCMASQTVKNCIYEFAKDILVKREPFARKIYKEEWRKWQDNTRTTVELRYSRDGELKAIVCKGKRRLVLRIKDN